MAKKIKILPESRTLVRDTDIIRRGTYEVFFLEIDPGMAEELLDTHNTRNRNLVQRNIEKFARDMRDGAWAFNGDTLRVSATGVLLDGQHRLHAVVRSGLTQTFLVVWGLPDEAQHVMDQGRKRTPGDQFKLTGHANSNHMASMLQSLVALEATNRGFINSYQASFPEMLTFAEKHEAEVQRAMEVLQLAKSKGFPASASAIGAAFFLCDQISPPCADEFFEQRLIRGVGIMNDRDPALVLRDRFVKLREEKTRVNADLTIRLALRAWNAHRDGRLIASIQAPKGGWARHNFPHPI